MQLRIRSSAPHANVLTHLFAKNPGRRHERHEKDQAVRFTYLTATDEEIDALLYVETNPMSWTKSADGPIDITHYIHDRNIVTSTVFLSLIRTTLGTALNGKVKDEWAEWVDHKFPLIVTVGPVATAYSLEEVTRLFEPLGYTATYKLPKEETVLKETARKSVFLLTLEGTVSLKMLLSHLWILLPILDAEMHHFLDNEQVEKLKRYGEGWLDKHPLREDIVRKYVKFPGLVEQFIPKQERGNTQPRLNDARYEWIAEQIDVQKTRTVVDFGAGGGKLSERLAFMPGIEQIWAVEPSARALKKAHKRFEALTNRNGCSVPEAAWGSLYYYDAQWKDKGAIVLCEVIEHIEEERLPTIFNMILHDYFPKHLILTTPNSEYNAVYGLETSRHTDHRFEWTRAEFQEWCEKMNLHQIYTITFHGIGEHHPEFGSPTQAAIFTRKEWTRP
ncbi:3' terminal RNA ribose 2'-O-methyltransferase Hen1 [Chryseomicrobium palamuruense]|uniref:Small RNA 2'-O-methyltransferase n=1 Tax=Chryseomicrobium palamuruense TaxID=682973 RepID=A0ABV8UUV7_9BACL